MRYQEPEFLPWDGRRVPLTFVAGYLGAGKTTLINRVLEVTDRPIAVFVNDVGEINVDAALIRRHSGDTIELSDGCVCCSLVDGFGAAFDELRARPTAPDHLIVELSGVADPARVLPWGRTAGFQLDGVITLAAADQIVELTERSDVGALVAAQVAAADLLAITKLDTPQAAPEQAVRAHLASIRDGVTVFDAADGTLPTSLLRIGGRRPGGVDDLPEATLFDRHEITRYPLATPTEVAQVEALLDSLGPDIMRAKAIFVDAAGSRWVVHVVGARRSITQLRDIESGATTDLIAISIR